MSKYIALAGAVVILLSFILQYGIEQKNHYNISSFQTIVNSAKEEAKQKGYFTSDITNRMKNNIIGEFKNIDESEIVVNVTTTPKYRQNSFDERELINYEVGVPIEKIVATNRLWGISDDENKATYYVKGVTASEALVEVEP